VAELKILYSIITLIILLTGCSSVTQPPNESASYADDLRFQGKYYLNSWELTISDASKIKKIAEVEKARRFAKGSDVYEIEGHPNHEVVAVEDKGNLSGFSIYVLYEGPDKSSHYPKIPYTTVKVIKIYKEKEQINVIKGEDVQKFISLFEQEGPHNTFLVDTLPQYTVLFLTDSALGYIYDISDKNGEFGLPMSESKLPKEIATYFIK
jgi:hypothetical protein